MASPPLPYAMPLKEAARFIGIGEKSLQRIAEQGRVPYVKHTAAERVPGARAGVWLFRTADLQRYIDSQFEAEGDSRS